MASLLLAGNKGTDRNGPFLHGGCCGFVFTLGASMQEQTTYNYKVVRQFAIMTVVWGIVGMTVGVMQGLMWRAVNVDGTLTYTFVESVKANYPFYAIRLLGGVMFLGGMFIMAYNTWKTVHGATAVEAPLLAPAGAHA